VVCIHNGIDPYHELLNRTDARRELVDRIEQAASQRPELGTVVGVIANFYPTKGLDTLLTAATRTPDAQYVIIGDGPLREKLEQRIEALGLEQRVFLCGRVPDARRYLHAFDLVVLPSRKEGFPWSILEAMAAKVPIVATTVGAVPEALEDERSALLVPPDDPVALADAVERITGSERLRQDLVISAHQQLLAHFTLREMVEKYKKLFRKLVE
jgi:glycosyltransferase involved in cell wall biosynthesis